jgi:hypothetical protein
MHITCVRASILCVLMFAFRFVKHSYCFKDDMDKGKLSPAYFVCHKPKLSCVKLSWIKALFILMSKMSFLSDEYFDVIFGDFSV